MVTVPLWRSPDDMNIPEDIYEEIVRIYGYDAIDSVPLTASGAYVPYTPEVALQRLVESYLIHDAHMDQCETYPWADEKSYQNFWPIEGELYTLLNPSAPELRYLRPEIIYSMMELVEKNHRTFDEIKCFDTGKIWPVINGKPTELKALGMVHYKKNILKWDEDTIFNMKAHLQKLLELIGVKEIEFVKTSHEWFHPKKQAEIKADGKIIGYIATIHPLVAQHYKIGDTAQVTCISLGMDSLKEYMTKPKETNVAYATLQDQIIYRDVCFVMDKDKTWETIMNPIKQLKNIGNIELFDLYA